MTSDWQLLIVRHAVAESREAFARSGQDDGLRPLSPSGRRKMKQVARGIQTLVPTIDMLAASPLVRAQQTADILESRYDGVARTVTESLAPGRNPATFGAWLRKQPKGTIVVVGHEPSLGTIATWLMTGAVEPRISIRKGGACLFTFPRRPAGKTAVLQWLLTPAQLLSIDG